MKKYSPPAAQFLLVVGLVLQAALFPLTSHTANQPPVVTLGQPAHGSTFITPTDVVLAATATDPDGTIVLVEFFRNGSSLATDNTPPYEFPWSDAPPGLYGLVARATDNEGGTAVSSEIAITIREPSVATPYTFIGAGGDWKYLDDGSDQGTNWVELGFADGAWAEGPAQLGYGDGDESTVISFGPDPSNKYVTTYFRRSFNVDDPAQVEDLTLNLLRDDGAIAYLNGVEVLRLSMRAGSVDYLTYADTAGQYGFEASPVSPGLLRAGSNVIAVEVHQGNASSSDVSFDLELTGVLSAPSNNKPVVSLTEPPDGSVWAAPANLSLTARAVDIEGQIANVAFFTNGNLLSSDSDSPYVASWNDVPTGVHSLTAVASDDLGLSTTSGVIRVTVSADTAPPVLTDRSPAPGVVTSLAAVTVTFSKPVVGVNASDLLINGLPAQDVSGSGIVYTFSFEQPSFGTVNLSWSANAGVNDLFTPPHLFDPGAPGSGWQYSLVDVDPPFMSALDPVAGATVAALASIRVTLNEPVTGVQAADLLINGSPAVSRTGSGSGPYEFSFTQPQPGPVQVAWKTGHGIQDASGNAFEGGQWSYTLNPSATGVVISEIMYHPASENVLEEYIELFNRGASPVDLTGWRISSGVRFTFPNVSIPAGAFWVVAADLPTFNAKYPGTPNVVGGWTGILGNAGEDIDLDDATGNRADSVVYADAGDWALRQLDVPDLGVRGWIWTADHDGMGCSAELINPDLSSNSGQNWAASLVPEGTPGESNSVRTNNIAPLILEARHFPIVPRSSQSVIVSARVVDETVGGTSVQLHHRLDGPTPPAFSITAMTDDGTGADAAAGDGVFTARLPAQPDLSVVEFYVQATDGEGRTRGWPAPAVDSDGTLLGQVANLLYQVDDAPQNEFQGRQPVYKFIMTEAERELLASIPGISSNQGPNSRMNGTFVSLDATGTELRYLAGFRNRGHGSRRSNPPNYRVDLRTDDLWKGVDALNLNSRQVHAQHFGSALARQAGADGPASVAVQVRVNGANLAASDSPMFGSYAANEVIAGHWAEEHVPGDDGGNVYRALRDITPPDFDYRTLAAYPQLSGAEDPDSYRNTWFKETNASEDDWTDLIGMLRVIGPNGITPFTTENVRQVVNEEQWLRHLAVMNLLGNAETGLNSGYNDDYYCYRGKLDPRFTLLFWDLDQILGVSSFASGASIFSATSDRGAGQTLDRFLHWPDFEPLYYRNLQDLIDGPFSSVRFHELIEQTLGDYVPDATRRAMETWMDARRATVQNVIDGLVPPATVPPWATLSGVPRSPTFATTATITVAGTDITHYRFQLDGLAYGPETAVTQTIQLTGANDGSHTLSVVGRNSAGLWQSTTQPTTATWVVDPTWPTVRLNELLARNDAAFDHAGTFPDMVELLNESASPVDLSGMRLTDNAANPDKFIFPPGTTLAEQATLVLWANNPDGTPGLHLGFGLSDKGEGLFLYHRVSNGGALLDSVEFGLQLPDRSIGRFGPGREWRLAQPTPGVSNLAQPLGDVRDLVINEWLAFERLSFPDDFVELYNPSSLPVALGGLYLTDAPNGAPFLHSIAALSYIDGGGFRAFLADGDPLDGADHVDFRLSADQGEIGLFDRMLGEIDRVIYGPQSPDLSTGRCPDGGLTQRGLVTPTPGVSNLCPADPDSPSTVTLVGFADRWRYEASGADLDTAWREPDHNDASWPEGEGLLALETCDCLPEPIRTPLSFTSPQQITLYFRTQFELLPSLEASGLQLTHIIDDGAVFYLNGTEIGRVNLPPGPVAFDTLASPSVGSATYGDPLSVPLDLLQTGDNTLAVEVHQNSATSSDLVFGLQLDALVVTNDPSAATLVINEIFANNARWEEPDQSLPDWVEIYNLSTTSVDLAGFSLSDTATVPDRWVLPPGSLVPAQGHLKVRFDAAAPASSTNTGFGLRAEGGSVYLFGRPADGGRLLDSVTYGLQPADWSIGRVPDGDSTWTLTLPTLGGPNLAATLAVTTDPRINEWMADPVEGDDWFELYNPNPQPMDISGLHLTDRLDQPNLHVLPPLSYLGAGVDGFQKLVADGNTEAGADHVSFALSTAGDTIGLATADAVTFLDAVAFGSQSAGVSEGRFLDGSATIVPFPDSVTPGRGNYLPLADVLVNEVLTHTDLPLEDAVEFANHTGDDVDISGWWLSDSAADLRKYMIPAGSTIPANGYAVFYEYQFTGPDADSRFAFSSARGDEVFLSQTDSEGTLTGYRATARFGPSANGVSFGRFPTSQGSHFTALNRFTFGMDNPPTVEDFRTGTGALNAAAKVGPIVISELMYHPAGTVPAREFLELHNFSATSVALFDPANPANTWLLRGGVDFDLPGGLSIGPGAFVLVVPFDPQTDLSARAVFEAEYGSGHTLIGPYAGNLSDVGESVDLLRPDPPQTLPGPDFGLVPYILVDRVDYRAQAPWPPAAGGSGPSLQRIGPSLYGNDPENWTATTATPGAGGATVEDSDGDGMPDDWESANGLNPAVNDARLDPDLDALSNLQEYLAGTDPQDPGSVLRLAPAEITGTTSTVRFVAVAGRTYTVQYRDSLVTGGWLKLADVDAPTVTQEVQVSDPDGGTGLGRYYRLTTPRIP